jgi:uncharacterized protein YbjT (DUF2867 family)
MAMKEKPVLVTGATGYVGGRLVPQLLQAGYRVRALGRSISKLKGRPWGNHPLVELAAGDVLILYTDGITEAMNREKAFYSAARLISAVEREKNAPVDAFTREVFRSVKEFTEGENLSDDITLLAIQFNG